MYDSVESMFEKSGAVLNGHFLLASGRHSPVYWEKFQVLQFPEYTVALCTLFARFFRKYNVQLVAGPTTGGVILAFETARQLAVRGIFAEKTSSGCREFRRGFNISPGERVLIVDDILTTGTSVREVVNAVNAKKGLVVGIAVLVDRSETPVDFGVPLFSCLHSVTETYAPENCPLCIQNIPLVKPGSS